MKSKRKAHTKANIYKLKASESRCSTAKGFRSTIPPRVGPVMAVNCRCCLGARGDAETTETSDAASAAHVQVFMAGKE